MPMGHVGFKVFFCKDINTKNHKYIEFVKTIRVIVHVEICVH